MDYDTLRCNFKPHTIRLLLIAESPPPAASVQSSRHFYRHNQIRSGDRLFINTVKALYPDLERETETTLEASKLKLLEQFQRDGGYMIEALDDSQPHEATKKQRQEKIRLNLPRLIDQVRTLASPDTKIILIKSNVFDVAAEPLRDAGFTVLNTALVDYPGQFNQSAYRTKLRALAQKSSFGQ
jgi:hypothetical protein